MPRQMMDNNVTKAMILFNEELKAIHETETALRILFDELDRPPPQSSSQSHELAERKANRQRAIAAAFDLWQSERARPIWRFMSVHLRHEQDLVEAHKSLRGWPHFAAGLFQIDELKQECMTCVQAVLRCVWHIGQDQSHSPGTISHWTVSKVGEDDRLLSDCILARIKFRNVPTENQTLLKNSLRHLCGRLPFNILWRIMVILDLVKTTRYGTDGGFLRHTGVIVDNVEKLVFELIEEYINNDLKYYIANVPEEPEPVRIAYIDLHPSGDVKSPETLLLIHGFPETSHQFRHVMTDFVAAGFRVIVPDYRGAGLSSKPENGYTKHRLAADLHYLVKDWLKITQPVHVVGHDIGGMIAHAYAALFPKDTASVVWGECPLPGTKYYEKCLTRRPFYHFHFHWQTDLPEALTQGKERTYLKHFYDRLCFNASAISEETVDHYVDMYSRPGGMRCGFNVYRAFFQDGIDNNDTVKKNGKLSVPCMALFGEHSVMIDGASEMSDEFYEKHEVGSVPAAAHWIAEENPKQFVEIVTKFALAHKTK